MDTQTFVPAGAARRALALFIDLLIVGAVSVGLGLVLRERMVAMGLWSHVAGFILMWVYFGLMNSTLCGGQTLAKRLGSLKVTDLRGNELSVQRSFMRSALVVLPVVVVKADVLRQMFAPVGGYLWWFVSLGLGGTLLYLLLFNRSTRRSLHDFAASSMVVHCGSRTSPSVTLQPVARLHLIIAGLIVAASLVIPSISPWSGRALAARDAINAMDGVQYCKLKEETHFGKDTTRRLIVEVFISEKNTDTKVMTRRAAAILFRDYPDAATRESVVVTLINGWSLGLASSSVKMSVRATPGQWQQVLAAESEPSTTL